MTLSEFHLCRLGGPKQGNAVVVDSQPCSWKRPGTGPNIIITIIFIIDIFILIFPLIPPPSLRIERLLVWLVDSPFCMALLVPLHC